MSLLCSFISISEEVFSVNLPLLVDYIVLCVHQVYHVCSVKNGIRIHFFVRVSLVILCTERMFHLAAVFVEQDTRFSIKMLIRWLESGILGVIVVEMVF